jgi:FAD/FMN-containing dehydrogenase
MAAVTSTPPGGDAMMRAAFATKYDRLAALKRKYDPTNLFSLNQNIKPG